MTTCEDYLLEQVRRKDELIMELRERLARYEAVDVAQVWELRPAPKETIQ